MLMRFDPFRELDRVFDQSFAPARPTSMPMDAYRRGDRFVLHLDLPGVEPATIDLAIEQNFLTISAERSWPQSPEDQLVATERRQGKFSRQLFLGNALDTEHITANYERGVLTVTIPVAEKAKPRRISVQAEADAARELISSN